MLNKNDIYQRAIYEIKLEDNFYEFVKEAWQYVDNTPFEEALHTKVLCDHMQAVADHKIDRLIINVPPGFGKSLICSVLYPVWIWIREPWHQFLTGSHSYVFALRDTRKSRELINSPWFQYFWGTKLKLCSDQNQKGMYQNIEGGYRTAFGTGSGFLGWRAHTIIFDDPNERNDRYSKATRDQRNIVVEEGLENRLHIIGYTAIIIIMQRLHPEDVTGYVLSNQKGWIHLKLPLIARSDNKCSTPFFKDKRRNGEILWKKFSKEQLKREMAKRTFPAMYQQCPTAEEGNIFLIDLFKYYKTLPEFKKIVISLDTAAKIKKSSDYSAFTIWGITETGYYLIYVWRGKVHYLELVRRLKGFVDEYHPNMVLIEDTALGIALIQEIARTTKICYKAITPPKKLSKEARAETVTPAFESGRVYFPEHAAWFNNFKDEVIDFPLAKNDDQVDSMVQFLREEMSVNKPPRFRQL